MLRRSDQHRSEICLALPFTLVLTVGACMEEAMHVNDRYGHSFVGRGEEVEELP